MTDAGGIESTALFCFETEAHGIKSYVWVTAQERPPPQ